MNLYEHGAAVSVFTYAIMAWLKKYIAKKFRPSASIIIACILAGLFSFAFGMDWKQTVIAGLAGGASSMGVHDTMKSMKKGKDSL